MKPTILYVEDDPESREIMQLLVKELMGLSSITMFENSHNFINQVQALVPQPDVFLLDIHVSPHDGFEMLQMLRQHRAYGDMPVIALTASVMNEEVKKLKYAGFDGVIAKPLDMDAFPSMLEQVISGENVWHIVG